MTSEPIPFKLWKKRNYMSNSQNSHMVTEEKNENTELVTFKEVKGTPFTVATEDGKHHVLLGNKRFSTHEIHADAVKEAKTVTWDKIFIVLGIAMEKFADNLKG